MILLRFATVLFLVEASFKDEDLTTYGVENITCSKELDYEKNHPLQIREQPDEKKPLLNHKAKQGCGKKCPIC